MTDPDIRQRFSDAMVYGTVRILEPIAGELAENTSDPPTKDAMALILKAIEILNPDDPYVLEAARILYKTEQDAAKEHDETNSLIDCQCAACTGNSY